MSVPLNYVRLQDGTLGLQVASHTKSIRCSNWKLELGEVTITPSPKLTERISFGACRFGGRWTGRLKLGLDMMN